MDAEIKHECPYCGSTNLTEPRAAVSKGSIEMFNKLGLPFPMIRDCKDCTCTLDVRSFVVGSDEYVFIKSKEGYEMRM